MLKIFLIIPKCLLKTAENYEFSHILDELTSLYFFPVFEKSLLLPPWEWGMVLMARIFSVAVGIMGIGFKDVGTYCSAPISAHS